VRKKYAKRTNRSRRKPLREEGEGSVDSSRPVPTVQLVLPIPDILAGLHGAIEETATKAGVLIMRTLLEEEVERLAGEKHKHNPDRQGLRWGKEESHVVFGGRKIAVARPRVRSLAGKEIPLERFRLFQAGSRMEEAVARQVIAGVSMRDYEGAVNGVVDGYGIRRSSVSRHWKAVSQERLTEFMERPLGGLNLVAVLIDGIEFKEALLVAALGVDATGKKYVLGIWQGTTENAELSKGLLQDLVRRGLRTDERHLFVLDGSKALAKAVRQVFGDKAEIQRCHVHKERNVLDHLPGSRQRTVRMRLRAAWNMKDHEEARSELLRLTRYLKDLNPSAAKSLEEGLDETLTLHRLAVPESLRRSLRTTNAIESCFSSTRKYCRNVKHWRAGNMTLRWAGTMMIEAERRFRRLKGFGSMPRLLVTLGRNVDSERALA
jgi:transposase-like protein